MSDISIFVVTHKDKVDTPDNKLLNLLQVGCANKNTHFEGMFHDDDGDNISKKNPYYCELTGIYWAWKNYQSDYYGIFHYRRYLSFSDKQFPIKFMPFIFGEVVEDTICSNKVVNKYKLDESSMRRIIEQYDYIAPNSVVSQDKCTVYHQYKYSYGHHVEDLDRVMEIINEQYPEYSEAMNEYLFGIKHYTCNMFIMKKELFHKYCEWMFDVLFTLEKSRDFSQYSSIDNRVMGYLAERLTGIFLTYLNNSDNKGTELQRVYFLSTNKNELKQLNTSKNKTFDIKQKVKSGISKCETEAKKRVKHIYHNMRYKPLLLRNLPTNYTNNKNTVTKISVDDVKLNDHNFYVIHGSINHFYQKADNKEFAISVTNVNGDNIVDGDVHIINEKISVYQENPNLNKYEISFFFSVIDINQDINFNLIGDDKTYTKTFNTAYLQVQYLLWKNAFFNASNYDDFNQWFLENKVTDEELDIQSIQKFNIEPKYSIIVPLYKTPKDFLEKMINSVRSQSYDNYELILVNASPDDTDVSGYLSDKIKEVKLKENLGITENTNFGIEEATGDFICFLDHDDIIESDTLFEYTKYLNEHPDTDMFYCDEDKIIKDKYLDPYFKPDFNIDLLCGINYVCHFLTCRTSIVKDIEKPTKIYDGAQDQNMTFRVAEKARHIAHIPKILYHWRIHEGSTASDAEQKSYTLETARLTIEHHMDRIGVPAKVIESPKVPRHYEVLYELKESPLVSIVIPNKDSYKLMKQCVESILTRSTYDNYEIIVVDNQSSDKEIIDYYQTLESNDDIKIIHYDHQYNFSSIVNYGVKHANGKYVVLLNNDTRVITDNWIEKMLGPCQREDIGVVGAKLLFPDNMVQHAGILICEAGPCHMNYGIPRHAPGYYNTAILPMDVSAVTGACMMTSKKLYNEVGGFDEYLATNYNDVDFCLKVRDKGLLVLHNPNVELYHYEGMTREKEEETEEGRSQIKKALSILMARYPGIFANGDPYYNPNFKKNSTYFTL